MSGDWMRLCALLDDDAELIAEVRSAADSADEADPWMIMLDGLDEAGALAYLNRKDSGPQLADALAGLPRVFATGVDLDAVGDFEGELPTVVARTNGILDEHGLTLVYLEEEPDAYPLVAVASDDADEIVSLASALGHTARAHL